MYELPLLLLIDKPAGITSMDVVRRLQRILGLRKIGHAGTLDPLATGLLIVGIGPGTKELAELIKLEKEYCAEIRIGERRSTGDLAGVVVEEKSVVSLEADTVRQALADMIGTLQLPVSAYSAIKVAGVPMYKRAYKAERKGEVIAGLPERDMQVQEAELVSYSVGGGRAVATVRFVVGSGTYIRSLAEELGRRLNYPATLQSLRRTKIGEFRIEDAKQIEDFI